MKIKIIIISFLIFGFVSCDNYLDLEPITEIKEEFVFSNVNAVEPLLIAAYKPLGFTYIGNLTGTDVYTLPFIYTDGRSDDVVIENYFFGGNKFHDFETLVDLTAANTMVRAVWVKFFTGVARANEIIGGLAGVSDDAIDPEIKNSFLAEARFLRALYYFDIAKNFGAAPIFDGIIDATDIELLRRKPQSEVYEFAASDLRFASENLPVSPSGDEFRASQSAALGMLSKVLLYQEKWQEAADIATQVMDLNVYQLESNYADNWDIDNEHGVESIYEISYDDNTAFVFDSRQTSSLSSQLSNPGGLISPAGGWNYNLPTPDLVEAFVQEGDVIRRQASILLEGDIIGSDMLAENGQDPFPIGFTEMEAGINAVTGTVYGRGSEANIVGHLGYARKFIMTPEDILATSSNIQHSPKNEKIMRYAELLLILAEAEAMGANTGGRGQMAFDMVRNRVGLDSKPLTLDAIKLERRLELATEWNRFHDLVRWGDAANHIRNFTSGRDELLPIPLEEILLTGTDESGQFILTQNPGY